MKFTDINEAIARSSSHDEIATVVVADKAAAKAAIAEAKAAAQAADLEFDYTDSNEGWDLWANKEDAKDGDMEWRLTVAIEEQE